MAKGVRVITNSPANDSIVLLESALELAESRVQWTSGLSSPSADHCFYFFFCLIFQFFLAFLVIWSQFAGLRGASPGLSPTAASSMLNRVFERV